MLMKVEFNYDVLVLLIYTYIWNHIQSTSNKHKCYSIVIFFSTTVVLKLTIIEKIVLIIV